MAGIALSLFLILALGMIGITVLMKTLQNYKPGRARIQADLKKIRAELAPLVADLVPWSAEEMEQLSFNQIKKSIKNGLVKTSKGVLTTVYHEPVIAWAYKKYVSRKENGLLYARTSNQEFIYRIKNGEVEMVVGEHFVGILNQTGTLVSQKGNKQLAQIVRNQDNLTLPLKVNNKLVGTMSNPDRNQKGNTRAFQYLTKMDKEEEEIALTLSILEMVKREIEG
ncbi:MAG: hypothetical protein K9J37_00030 [Saprospiraceae bacterium]|nr:hypothetical protein [Saprospiraceae bacterium]MCF8248259.1 hypothetical protein [Saprospiraceae bacterium]MCF8279987.1 hypothetical protein [Bacteroidales bacterium]MCF8309787.1 hypothetical protein [Saprospiraceae bacterium]MCF8438882.1 hypothetical protein [Saprospiraceae bacterium]